MIKLIDILKELEVSNPNNNVEIIAADFIKNQINITELGEIFEDNLTAHFPIFEVPKPIINYFSRNPKNYISFSIEFYNIKMYKGQNEIIIEVLSTN